ncbi:heme peroxidase family protein [Actinoplanes sp. TBRC 11911]|uniref:peroxidase family protein n=1 Tax=Actinoplanes sp. TBRC 11911 TaxID=2729386 RepID=UPI001B7D5E51|nr:heme peroxidase family protein [Actinoplanes sp. TBRC 11911]
MRRHERDKFFVVDEGVFTGDGTRKRSRPNAQEEIRSFRFSRLGPANEETGEDSLHTALATAMTTGTAPDSAGVPAGFTYLGQFVDHDLTMDNTATVLGTEVTVEELLQGRSPALDLDSLYGRGPDAEPRFYQPDKIRLKTGKTAAVPGDPVAGRDLDGFDLPRVGEGSTKGARRLAVIPDSRNDENLIVAQTHLAFIRFHNKIADTLVAQGMTGAELFAKTRELVTLHYQWIVRHDFLPRVIDPAIVDDVFTNGRKLVDAGPGARIDEPPTMPIEFSVAAYRFGHSMVRDQYEWNRFFNSGAGAITKATLPLLFNFSGTSGTLSPDGKPDDPETGGFERLPTNWCADFRRLYDFTEAGRDDLKGPGVNLTKRVDSLLVDPLKAVPAGSFNGRGSALDSIERNLAFRNLTRASMVDLATGQQMAELLGEKPLTASQLLDGDGSGAALKDLADDDRDRLVSKTPLWFYILREAEVNDGKLGAVGGRIVVETFHRAIEASRISIVRQPAWRPTLGAEKDVFRMVDLLLFLSDGKEDLLNPLGDPS